MLVTNNEKKLFLGERLGHPGVWQFPQGGIEQGLSEEENVLRELEEELGADRHLFSIVRRLQTINEYEWDAVPEYAKGRFRGQSQSYWVVEYVGRDEDINLSRFNAEFSNWRWCSSEEVVSLAEPKRLKGYLAALKEMAEAAA